MARKRASMREGPLAELFRATEAAQQQAARKEDPEPAGEAPAAAAEGGLDRDGQAVLLGEGDDLVGAGDGLLGAGHERCSHPLGDVARPHLVAEVLDG